MSSSLMVACLEVRALLATKLLPPVSDLSLLNDPMCISVSESSSGAAICWIN